MRRKLETVKTDSAPGPDGLHPKLLQLAAEPLTKPLASLFRESLDQRIVSEVWKTATVLSIFKKGSKQEPGIYRPISLASIPCKIMESLIRDALMEFLLSTHQLSRHQHSMDFSLKDHATLSSWKF